MRQLVLYFFLLLTFIGSFSCKKDKLKAPKASFLLVNTVSLLTTPTQGENTEKITDIWYYVNDQFKGVFPVGSVMPIVASANADADAIVSPLDEQDDQDIRTAYGEGAEGKGLKTVERQMKSSLKTLEDRIKARRRRVLSDQYDRVLLDLTGYYRDVLVIQSGASVELINEEIREVIDRVASVDDESATLQKIAAITETRDQIVANVNPLNAFESLLVTLRDPKLNAIVG